MNYELAKKLKDAGFPQWNLQKKGDRFCKGTKKECYIPTLFELIKECGDGFQILNKTETGDWEALSDDKPFLPEPRSAYYNGEGKTPEEAVAKLWLELNKQIITAVPGYPSTGIKTTDCFDSWKKKPVEELNREELITAVMYLIGELDKLKNPR